jgi:hypothetical protein
MTDILADRTVRDDAGVPELQPESLDRFKDPAALSPDDVKAFVRYLAVDRNVAASTQNQGSSINKKAAGMIPAAFGLLSVLWLSDV